MPKPKVASPVKSHHLEFGSHRCHLPVAADRRIPLTCTSRVLNAPPHARTCASRGCTATHTPNRAYARLVHTARARSTALKPRRQPRHLHTTKSTSSIAARCSPSIAKKTVHEQLDCNDLQSLRELLFDCYAFCSIAAHARIYSPCREQKIRVQH